MALIEFLTIIGKTLGHYRVEGKLGAGRAVIRSHQAGNLPKSKSHL